MTDPAPEKTDPDRDKALRAVYQKATSRLREAHKKEFDTYRAEEAAKAGIELVIRQSPEEKAREDLKKLLAANPALEEEVTQQVLAKHGVTTG